MVALKKLPSRGEWLELSQDSIAKNAFWVRKNGKQLFSMYLYPPPIIVPCLTPLLTPKYFDPSMAIFLKIQPNE